MYENAPQKLDYLALPPQQPSRANVAAAISLGCGLGAIAFVLSLCAGAWQSIIPLNGPRAGLIVAALALGAIINGAIGAMRAPKDSVWYNVALFGYAMGIFVGTLSPMLFLL